MANVIVFDLDRTVIRMGSYTPFLLCYARTRAPWQLALFPIVVILMLIYKARIISRGTLKELMFLLLIGSVKKETLNKTAQDFADKTIARKCYDGAKSAIRAHIDNGDTLILATASFSFYARLIATQLGFQHCIGSKLAENKTHYLPRIIGENCYGKAKADHICSYLKEHDLPETIDTFYTDDVSDLPTLKMAAARVLINPSNKFKAIAQTLENTRILSWK